MRAKITTSATLLILPLIFIGLVACATDSGVTDSGITTGQAEVIGETLGVSEAIDTHADDTAQNEIVADVHVDEDQHATDNVDSHDSEATALAKHDEDPHADTVSEGHQEEATGASPHVDMDGPVDPDAPVMHLFAFEFSYDTATIEVEAGQPFSIQIHNEGSLEHDITFVGFESEFGLHVLPGEDNIATWAIHEPGEYLYYCTVLGHREAGMTGTLVVVSGESDGGHVEADGHQEEADPVQQDEHVEEDAHEDDVHDDATSGT
ncbi:cupredoxin domain-containing protein [Dehalococcoides mccartyi]|nr:cupredoxin domain-containing protein [Dehalococcoides mccartyi]